MHTDPRQALRQDKHSKALRPWFSSPKGTRRNVESQEPKGFLLSTVRARIDAANGPVWAAPIYTDSGYTPVLSSSLLTRDWISNGLHGEKMAAVNESLPLWCSGPAYEDGSGLRLYLTLGRPMDKQK